MAAHVVCTPFQAEIEVGRISVDTNFVVDIVNFWVHTNAAKDALATVTAVWAVNGAGAVVHRLHIVFKTNGLAAAVLAR